MLTFLLVLTILTMPIFVFGMPGAKRREATVQFFLPCLRELQRCLEDPEVVGAEANIRRQRMILVEAGRAAGGGTQPADVLRRSCIVWHGWCASRVAWRMFAACRTAPRVDWHER